MTPARQRALAVLLVAAALFALYLPSSVGGVISRPLSIVSIAGTCALLLGISLLAPAGPPALNAAVAISIPTLLLLFTILSPFQAYSPGVAMLYAAQALLFTTNLGRVPLAPVRRAFWLITVVSLALGAVLAVNVGVADRAMVRWYGAFYPELVSNMVVLDNKPVLTFATHSMAGFMIYLFFYMHLRAWQSAFGRAHLWAALGFLALLVLLKSTTGQAFAAVAFAQLLWRLRWSTAPTKAALVVGVPLLVVVALQLGPGASALADRITDAVVGDRVRGLFSRYAADGLLASNVKYLSDSPLRPIGVGATDTLYLGDSGIVVNLLRGSFPLLVAVYGALWLFLRTNIRDHRAAGWLWFCTVLFEIGFTPLHYFRFLAFAPLAVVFLNATGSPPLEPTLLEQPGLRDNMQDHR